MESQQPPCQYLADRIKGFAKPSIFEEMTGFSIKNKAVNLGQGFPDWAPPKFVLDGLAEAAYANENQYCKVVGHPDLLKAIAELYGKLLNRTIDPNLEVSIGNGAQQVMVNAVCAFINPGDECIIMEPFFEYYIPAVLFFQGVNRFIKMTPPNKEKHEDNWTLNMAELEKMFNEKTRFIYLNSPHNPTGKVWTKEEYEQIAAIVRKWPRVIVIADEVYEWMVHDKREMIRFANIEGMWERTISVYSAGKSFSITGWRIGWGIGPALFMKGITNAQNWISFNTHRPSQVAIAKSIKAAYQPYEGEVDYFVALQKLIEKNRNTIYDILKACPMKFHVYKPEGGYFILVDICDLVHEIPRKYFFKEDRKDVENPEAPLGLKDFSQMKEEPDYTPDVAFSKWLTVEVGVSPIPLFSFYDKTGITSLKEIKTVNFVRFAFCKKDETLGEAGKKFEAYGKKKLEETKNQKA